MGVIFSRHICSTFRPFGAKLVHHLAVLLHVLRGEMKEIGYFQQFHVDGFIGDDEVVFIRILNDAHAERKRRDRMPKDAAGRPHVRPVLTTTRIKYT